MAKLVFRSLLRWVLKGVALVAATGVALGVLANLVVLAVGNSGILSGKEIQRRGATGVVLGTAPKTAGGGSQNPFFEGRMDAAAHLYHAGVLQQLLLSGDNRHPSYNEPEAMRDALRQRGLPDGALLLDGAGIRTMDSIQRAKSFYALERPIIITDDFHLHRALFLARVVGLEAEGYASSPIPWKRSYPTRLREWLSRIRACGDALGMRGGE